MPADEFSSIFFNPLPLVSIVPPIPLRIQALFRPLLCFLAQANANDFSAERQKYLKRNLRLNGLFIVSNRQRNVRIFVCYGSYCYPKRIVNNETELELEREKYTLFRCRISAGNFQLSLPLSPSIHTLFVVRAYWVKVICGCKSFIEATKLSDSVKSINKIVWQCECVVRQKDITTYFDCDEQQYYVKCVGNSNLTDLFST